MCAWADERDFAHIGVGEHHQSADGYLSAPLVFAAAVGGRTRRIRVRCSVLLAVLYDPVRLAEEIAVADLCLGGRLDVGLGVGYVEADFSAFATDFHTRGAALDEVIPFLRQAWTGEPFEYRGTTVRVTPRPVQDPMPIHVGGASRRGVERAVSLADGYYPPGMPAGWRRYRRLSVEAGRPDPGEYPRPGPSSCGSPMSRRIGSGSVSLRTSGTRSTPMRHGRRRRTGDPMARSSPPMTSRASVRVARRGPRSRRDHRVDPPPGPRRTPLAEPTAGRHRPHAGLGDARSVRARGPRRTLTRGRSGRGGRDRRAGVWNLDPFPAIVRLFVHRGPPGSSNAPLRPSN